MSGPGRYDAAWQFHAVCEGLAALELRGIIETSAAARQWEDALRLLITGWATIPPDDPESSG
jgi:hypothetical protein